MTMVCRSLAPLPQTSVNFTEVPGVAARITRPAYDLPLRIAKPVCRMPGASVAFSFTIGVFADVRLIRIHRHEFVIANRNPTVRQQDAN